MAIEIDPDLLAQLRQLPKAERRKVGAAIESVHGHWGRPRLHTGAGIRRLGADLHECRIGLQARLLFQNIGSSLYVDSFVSTHVALRVPHTRNLSRAPLRSGIHFIGNHDEVQKFLSAHTCPLPDP